MNVYTHQIQIFISISGKGVWYATYITAIFNGLLYLILQTNIIKYFIYCNFHNTKNEI